MSPERNENPITLEEIISNAKEIMLRDGYHVPVVIMEVDKKLMGAQIPSIHAWKYPRTSQALLSWHSIKRVGHVTDVTTKSYTNILTRFSRNSASFCMNFAACVLWLGGTMG
jgi:hypothetical protein